MLLRFKKKYALLIIIALFLQNTAMGFFEPKINCDSILSLINSEEEEEKLYQHLLVQIQNLLPLLYE